MKDCHHHFSLFAPALLKCGTSPERTLLALTNCKRPEVKKVQHGRASCPRPHERMTPLQRELGPLLTRQLVVCRLPLVADCQAARCPGSSVLH